VGLRSKDDDSCHGGSSGVDELHIQKLYLNGCVYSARLTMLSTIPIDLSEIDTKNVDKEILRASIIAELDAINLYEQMASLTKSEAIKANLLDVAREEKTHVGEFHALLLQIDSEQADELEHGKREVEELAEK
jgi:rubrerythrin